MLVYIKWRFFARLSPRFGPPYKHTSFLTERESKKRSEKVMKLITECAARGGAFALVTPHESRPLSLSAAECILYYCSLSSLIPSLVFCFFIARFAIHFTPFLEKMRENEGSTYASRQMITSLARYAPLEFFIRTEWI